MTTDELLGAKLLRPEEFLTEVQLAGGARSTGALAAGQLVGWQHNTVQVEGIDWLIDAADDPDRQVRVLADDPGMGKTIQTLGLIQHILAMDRSAQILIVCPASLEEQWVGEIKKFMPGVKSGRFLAGATREISVISPGKLKNRMADLKNMDWAAVIVDEVSEGKPTVTVGKQIRLAKNSQQIKHLTAEVPLVLGLTATMQENSPVEPWGILDSLNAPGLPPWSEYSKWLEWKTHKAPPFGPQRPPEARDYTAQGVEKQRELLSRFVLRRSAEESGLKLPKRVGDEEVWVKLTQQQQERYDAAEGMVSRAGTYRQTLAGIVHEGISPVAEAAVRELRKHSDKTIVYSEYFDVLDAAEAALRDAGISYVRVDGRTTQQAERSKALQHFLDPKGPRVLLTSRIVERGFNLQSCRRMYSLDCSWNPCREFQRRGRICRINSPHDSFEYVTFLGDTELTRAKRRTLDRKTASATSVGLA